MIEGQDKICTVNLFNLCLNLMRKERNETHLLGRPWKEAVKDEQSGKLEVRDGLENKIKEIFTGKRVRARKLLGKGQKRLKSMNHDQIESFARNRCTC